MTTLRDIILHSQTIDEAPIYVTKPYIVLSKENVVMFSGTWAEIFAEGKQSTYYHDCTVEVRKHDLYLNDNTKIKDSFPSSTLKTKDVYYQTSDVPEHLVIWQDENAGIAALVQAANDIVAGKIVRFALCNHEPHKTPTINEVVTLAMGKDGPRYCGENRTRDGVGSHALIGPYYGYCKDPAAIATALALSFAAHKKFFRLAVK